HRGPPADLRSRRPPPAPERRPQLREPHTRAHVVHRGLLPRGQVRARVRPRPHRHPSGRPAHPPPPPGAAPAPRVGGRRLRSSRGEPLRVKRRLAFGAVAFALLTVAAGAYVAFAAVHAARVNLDPRRYDQSTYLDGARALHDGAFAPPTNRSQM